MTLLFACAFVLLHALAIWLLPAFAIQASYFFLLLAPVLALAAALRRAARNGWSHSRGWLLAALAMAFWTMGMLASLRQDLYLANANAAPGDSMLLFILFGVPIVMAVSASSVEGEALLVRLIDGALALALGYLFYVHTFSLLTVRGADSIEQAQQVAAMFDAENLFLLLASAIRLAAAERRAERHFFRAVVLFTGLNTLASFYYNHFVALGDHPDFGSLRDPLIDVAFLAFAVQAWHDPSARRTGRRSSPALSRIVRTGSPLLMALALLVVAVIVLRERFYFGVAGLVVAVVGYGVRTTLVQVSQIQAAEGLARHSHALEEMAHTDSLTGLANRRALDEVLEREWVLREHATRSIAVLMIDIDYFKQLNDRYGHPAGDACLRMVGRVLLATAGRPGDVLGRYGGEEFALVMCGGSLADAQAVGERLRAAVEKLAIANADSPFGIITVSIGAASGLVGEGSPDTLMAAADAALYAAKQAGRNRVTVAG
ncbi:GGDEF domain-containing protein [Dyella sp.]|jgi:diguanylate cyclase (GGDEF)-like protein|uniref:GGDEF domain-containing protein n=1 Tax=Dyella sp. TaxID=1869338 RepID=UPI002D76B4E0|nr:GGDEF domain-containing protein [Dyella sp.]HET6431299.1 GGDEF domain-containing protein [Dyella sp.]